MVGIAPIKAYIPKNPEDFTTNPYDIIGNEEEMELKKNPNSFIHMILPDGKGDEKYQNAANQFNNFVKNAAIEQVNKSSIFVYRQESAEFSHQGFIMGVALQDYVDGNIVIHEHTREKPLADRIKHIATTNAATGLVWNVYKTNDTINNLMEKIKEKEPLFNFEKYGYKHLVWQESEESVLSELINAFASEKIYIADGHHRAASANAYREKQLETSADKGDSTDVAWNYLLTYIASDDQVRIYPYNRVIRKLPLDESEFLSKLEEIYAVEKMDSGFNPEKKHEVALCCKGTWYKLTVKQTEFPSKEKSLDVSILQDNVLNPILGITDPRASDNLFFVGGTRDTSVMEKYVTEQGNDLFINLYPVNIRDLEDIGEVGGIMPPKSTWFDPKVLSGLVIHKLD